MRTPSLFCLIVLWVLTWSGVAVAAQPEDDWLEQLSVEEFRAAGLHKLTPEERDVLLRLIREHGESARATAADTVGNFGLDRPVQEVAAPESIQAMVLEPFNGWSGKTRFQLDNGQVWQQRASGRYYYSGEDNRVVISRNALGFYEMRLLDADRAVGVRRLK